MTISMNIHGTTAITADAHTVPGEILKTIVLTWTDRRSWLPTYGKPLAALWTAAGDDTALNEALAYTATENRKSLDLDYRVHTFAPSETLWKTLAQEAHRHAVKYAP